MEYRLLVLDFSQYICACVCMYKACFRILSQPLSSVIQVIIDFHMQLKTLSEIMFEFLRYFNPIQLVILIVQIFLLK